MPSDEHSESFALERAIVVARENHQLAIWDLVANVPTLSASTTPKRDSASLSDEQAGIMLNRDPRIAREWKKWNLMTPNQGGSLILIDPERVQRVLEGDNGLDEDDDGLGLA